LLRPYGMESGLSVCFGLPGCLFLPIVIEQNLSKYMRIPLMEQL